MKRLLCLLIIVIFLQSFLPVVAVEEISVLCNGKKIIFDVLPVMEGDRVLVPFRKIFEAIGAVVTWEEPVATAELNGNRIQVTLDRYVMQKNGAYIFLDVPAKLCRDRTMVPVRAVAEGLGAEVEWQENTQTVIISVPDKASEKPADFPGFPEVPDFAEVIEGVQLVSSVAYGGGKLYRVPDRKVALEDYGKSLKKLGFVAEEKEEYTCYQKNDVKVLTGMYQEYVLIVLQRTDESVKVLYFKNHPETPDFGACFSVPVLEETGNSVTYDMFSIELSALDQYFQLLAKEGFRCILRENGDIYCVKAETEMVVSYKEGQLCMQWLE